MRERKRKRKKDERKVRGEEIRSSWLGLVLLVRERERGMMMSEREGERKQVGKGGEARE